MKLPLYGLIRKSNLPELYLIKSFSIPDNNITTYKQIVDIFVNKMNINLMETEGVYLFCMMGDGSPICICEISKGDKNNAKVSINTIGRMLLLTGADHFVVLHNHPHNSSTPSNDDIFITNEINKLGQFIDVKLEDHIIISRRDWYSIILRKRCAIK